MVRRCKIVKTVLIERTVGAVLNEVSYKRTVTILVLKVEMLRLVFGTSLFQWFFLVETNMTHSLVP